MQQRKVLPRIINLAVFILLEIASLQVITRNAELQQTWMARAAQGFKGKVWGGTEAIRQYFSLSKTNRELAEENYALLQDLTFAREQLRAVGLDSLELAQRDPGFSFLNAEVVKISRNKQHNYIVINRGYEDGVQEKSGIITRQGVVGIVDAVSAHHSFAFSFQNNDISISARLGEEGGSGLLVWDGVHSNGAILKEIPLQFRYEPGDTVFTSGHSLFFPPDIPLGVTGGSRVVNGSTNEIAVTLFQDFSAVRFVTVVHNNSFDEIEEFRP